MSRRPFILLSILLLSIFQALANPVIESEALQLATNFHQQRFPSRLRSTTNLKLVYQGITSNLRSTATDPAFYIYNIGDNQGFVIVSGEDAAKTILGYADEGIFQTDSMPENLKNWLFFYQLEIEGLRDASITATASSSEQVSMVATSTTSIAPLLGNIKWNQTDPYNQLCPLDVPTTRRTLAGCVAIAMAQIMKYYNWPVTGTGTHNYTHPIYGQQSVDFSKTSYDWSNILGSYSSTANSVQKSAVSTLVYQCGVAVDMAYSPTGSSAYSTKAAEALVSHFGYDTDLQRYDRLYYSETEWNTLIKKELNIARPVYFSARNTSGGHAFVCDGYDSNNLFHINWGWGGSFNGYFELSALASDNPGVIGATGGFCYLQSILAGIHKADAINNVTHQLGIYNTPLTNSLSSLSDISKSSFTLTFNMANNSLYSDTFKIGIGYIQNGSNTLTMLAENATLSILSANYHYTTNLSFTIKNPTVLSTAGTYRLYPIYMPKDSAKWNIIRGTDSLSNCLIVTVASTKSATILPPSVKPVLTLTKALSPLSRLYQNKSVYVDVTLQNTGKEFFSYFGLCLVSATNPNNRTYICETRVSCLAGETKTFQLSGTVTSPPGNYYLLAQFDSTDTNSRMKYKTFGPTNFNTLAVEILPKGGTPALQLNNTISMSNGTMLSKNDTVNLTANITNMGGYFDSRISAYVFPKSGGQSLMSLTPKYVSIDSLETKEVTLTGLMELDGGDYFINLYYLMNNNWTFFSPSNMVRLNFTVTNGITEIKPSAESNPLVIHQDGVQIRIQTSSEIRQSQLYDLSGRLLRKGATEKTIQVGDLSPGVYLLHVQTNEKNYLERFLKR